MTEGAKRVRVTLSIPAAIQPVVGTTSNDIQAALEVLADEHVRACERNEANFSPDDWGEIAYAMAGAQPPKPWSAEELEDGVRSLYGELMVPKPPPSPRAEALVQELQTLAAVDRWAMFYAVRYFWDNDLVNREENVPWWTLKYRIENPGRRP